MTQKIKTRIHDEENRRWVVMLRDPAYEAVRKLEKAGLAYIVLPRQFLITGVLEPAPFTGNVRLDDCLAELGDDF